MVSTESSNWTPERHAEVKARCEAATKGPWVDRPHVGNFPSGRFVIEAPSVENRLIAEMRYSAVKESRADESVANAEFITRARTDLPDALKEIERLTAELRDAYGAMNEAITELEHGTVEDAHERLMTQCGL